MHTAESPKRWGYAHVALAAALWAVSGSAAKLLFQAGLSPQQLVQLRTTIATAVLLPAMLILRPAALSIRGRDLPYFIMLGIGLAVAQFTYLFAISRVQVAAAILLQYQAPVFIAAYALLFNRARLSLITGGSLLAAVAGCYLMVGGYRLNILTMNQTGIMAGLASAAAFAWYTVRSEHGMRSYTPWTVLFYALLFAAVTWNIIHPPLSAFSASYPASAWWAILLVGTCGTVLPFGFYNKGVGIVGSTRGSITATLEPVIAGVVAYFLLGEAMELIQLAGGGLVIAAIIMLQLERKPS